jgi:hypothetical protein
MDDWGFEQLESRLKVRQGMPVGPLFCVHQRTHLRSRVAIVGRPRGAQVARRARASAGASCRTSSGTPTLWSSRTRACP